MKTKIEKDTGGGCSVCGGKPAVNVEGTYWLCGECVYEKFRALMETVVQRYGA